jgi:hypothetical protein
MTCLTAFDVHCVVRGQSDLCILQCSRRYAAFTVVGHSDLCVLQCSRRYAAFTVSEKGSQVFAFAMQSALLAFTVSVTWYLEVHRFV